jgi:hypothetical protein
LLAAATLIVPGAAELLMTAQDARAAVARASSVTGSATDWSFDFARYFLSGLSLVSPYLMACTVSPAVKNPRLREP